MTSRISCPGRRPGGRPGAGSCASGPTRRRGRGPASPATSISSRHQPIGRHAAGSTIRTACTRRSGMVSATVPSSPRRIRIPSGDWAMVKPYSVAIRRHTRGASVIRDTTSVPPTAVSTFGDTRIATTSATSSAASRLAAGGRHRPDQAADGDAGQDLLARLGGSRDPARGARPAAAPAGRARPAREGRRAGRRRDWIRPAGPAVRPGQGRGPGTAGPRPPPGSGPPAAAGSHGAAGRSRYAAWPRPASTG